MSPLTFLKVFFARKDVKFILISTAIGGILQVVSRRYLKTHPEFLNDLNVKQKPSKRRRLFEPRGGAFIEISGISIKIITKVVIKFLAEKGLLAGLLASTGIILSKLPAEAIAAYVRDAFPQNLPHLEKKKYIFVYGEKIYLDQCDNNLKYLFQILENPDIPYDVKEREAYVILTKYLNLTTMEGRATFIVCIVLILYILWVHNPSSFFILIKNLIKAIKEGRISKEMGRLIVRKLLKQNIIIDPELLKIVEDTAKS